TMQCAADRAFQIRARARRETASPTEQLLILSPRHGSFLLERSRIRHQVLQLTVVEALPPIRHARHPATFGLRLEVQPSVRARRESHFFRKGTRDRTRRVSPLAVLACRGS